MDTQTGKEVRVATVTVAVGGALLDGDLALPAGAQAMVLFAHGSGSSRHSPRNRYVAGELQDAGLGTLLLDLLTPREEAIDTQTGHLRFDIDLLAGRLVGATDWLLGNAGTRDLRIGYFGASTGAAAALVAETRLPGTVSAIVSRGGRPDLAGDALPAVSAPTLFIVGGSDGEVMELNRIAMARMTVRPRLEVVAGATHLFEEPGALEQVAALARRWFLQHMALDADAAV